MKQGTAALAVAVMIGCEPKPDAGNPTDTGPDIGTEWPDDGCISINGEGGFATISDAIEWADDGDTIAVCAGTYNEKLRIDKAVTVKGPSTGERAVLIGPPDDSAVSIRSSGVALQWFTINSSSSGIYVNEVDDVLLAALDFGSLASTAIRVAGATNLTVQSCTFEDIDTGPIYMDEGGSIRIYNNVFEGNSGNAVYVTDGATVSLETNEFYGNMPNDDGFNAAVRVTNGTALTATNNVFSGNTGKAISASDADVQSSNDTFTLGTMAIQLAGGSLSVDGAVVTNPTVSGIVAQTSDGSVDIRNTVVSVNPDSGLSLDQSEWNSGNTTQAVGLHLAAQESIVLDAVDVSGFNNAGVVLDRRGNTNVLASLNAVTIDNAGWMGLFATRIDASITDLHITNTRTFGDMDDTQCTSVGSNSGAAISNSVVDWVGGTIRDNDGYGLSGSSTTMTLSGLTVGGNTCAGIMNFGGTAAVDDSDFSAAGGTVLAANVIGYSADATSVTNSRFTDTAFIGVSDRTVMDYGSIVYEYVYYDRIGTDVQFFFSGDNRVENNAFTNGAQGVLLQEADATVLNNTWTDYSAFGVFAYMGEATIDGTTFGGGSGHFLACRDGSVSVTDATISDTTASTERTYEVYIDGVLSSSSTQTLVYPTTYLENCTATMTNATMTNLAGSAIRGLAGETTLSDLTIERANGSSTYGTDAVQFENTYTSVDGAFVSAPMVVEATDIRIADTQMGAALSYSGTTGADGTYQATGLFTGLTVDTGTSYGVNLSSVSVNFVESSVNGAGYFGIYATSAEVGLTNSTVENSASTGIHAFNSSLVLNDSSVFSSSGPGVFAQDGTISMIGGSSQFNANNGITLSGSAGVASLAGVNIANNSNYGLQCGDFDMATCEVSFEANGMGPTTACPIECDPDGMGDDGEAPGDEDTGIGDTGM
ncbi:MAG: right-handed parallel beta-helix repeat-containing protein [Myxococcota bacterium]|nr:right-handed parallel beta-helix repeat-containing protein [Myxococcota bacterium]